MPALATQNSVSEKAEDKSTVTAINANARIDYILKFSKQLVVVIDEENAGFSAIPGQFLTSLPENNNSALVSVSSKLNDVQVRSRVIEQLFPSVHFDSEQSLTQSIINFYGNTNEQIAIVIEQAHHLSLQIIHELCLLAEMAKKTKRHIDIVLLGANQISKTIADNQLLFNKKISIISAQTGQLISISAEQFKEKQGLLAFTPSIKFLSLIGILISITAIVLFSLYQRDVMSFSQLEVADTQGSIALSKSDDKNVTTIATSENTLDSVSIVETSTASPDEILDALLIEQPSIVSIEQATSDDIFNAIAPQNNVVKTTSSIGENFEARERLLESQKEDPSIDDRLTKKPSPQVVAWQPHELQISELSQGYVIQFVALAATSESDINLITKSFAEQHKLSDYQYYQRKMNNKRFIVITSAVYKDKPDTITALNRLPEGLKATGIWIKSVASILNEQTVQ